MICFTPGAADHGISGRFLGDDFKNNPDRPVDQILQWHYRQAVLINVRRCEWGPVWSQEHTTYCTEFVFSHFYPLHLSHKLVSHTLPFPLSLQNSQLADRLYISFLFFCFPLISGYPFLPKCCLVIRWYYFALGGLRFFSLSNYHDMHAARFLLF